MNQSDAFIFGATQEIEDLGGGIKRQIMGHNQQILMAKIWFDDNAIGYVHTHHHAQVSYVESGEFEIQIDGVSKVIKAGDCFYVEPSKEHGAVCLKAGVLIDVFSPCREDFLAN